MPVGALTTAEMGPLHLRHLGVKPRTLKLYRSEVALFFEHLELHRLGIPNDFQKLDQLLAEYINHLFQEGESISRAGWLLSGFKRLYPRVRRELCIASQWYMNWTRSHTPERATPITWRILRADVGLCFDEGWYHLGTVLLLGFTFMLRTNEFLMLKKSDVSFQGSPTIMLRLAAAKTAKQFEQSLVFDDEVVVKLVQKGLQQIRSESLWPFSTSYFRKCFHAIHRFLGLEQLELVPYSLRRGSATHFYQFFRNLDFVMIQGRWRDQRTARLYLDDARASLIKHQDLYQATGRLKSYLRVFHRLASGVASL